MFFSTFLQISISSFEDSMGSKSVVFTGIDHCFCNRLQKYYKYTWLLIFISTLIRRNLNKL